MAMAQCPECGNEVSDRAPSCPHCGIVYDYEDIVAQRGSSLLSSFRFLLPLMLLAAYLYIVGVEYFDFTKDSDAQLAMTMLNFMGSSVGLSGDGYFFNSETAIVLIGNTYHGLRFSESPPVSIPIIQNMFLVVGLVAGSIIGTIMALFR
jgi:hypothetical protein